MKTEGLTRIVTTGQGRTKNWSCHHYPEDQRHILVHYSTTMLEWQDTDTGPKVLRTSTGHGSVTDQQGMNAVFRALGIPLYFSRRGGASIIPVDDCGGTSPQSPIVRVNRRKTVYQGVTAATDSNQGDA